MQEEVLVVQRICPHYRVPLFEKLCMDTDFTFTVLFGSGERIGSQTNATDMGGVRFKQLFSIGFNVKVRNKLYFMTFMPFLPLAIWNSKAKLVITEGGKANLFNNLFLIPIVKLLRKKLIWWEPGPLPKTRITWHTKVSEWITLRLIKMSDGFLAYSTRALHYLQPFTRKPIVIAHNAAPNLKSVSLDKIAKLKKDLGIEEKTIILSVGALEVRKRTDDLIRAFKIIQCSERDGSVLLIIGNGSDRRRLQQLVKEENIDNVIFLGAITAGIEVYFAVADVFVLPGEGGLAINQAMSSGLPVIATVADGTEADLIKQGENGYILPVGDIDELARVLKVVLADRGSRQAMGKKSQEIIESKFTIDKMVEVIKGLLQSIS